MNDNVKPIWYNDTPFCQSDCPSWTRHPVDSYGQGICNETKFLTGSVCIPQVQSMRIELKARVT